MKPTRPFSETRSDLFRKDPKLVAAYLEECLSSGDTDLFKAALKHVADARLGGIGALSQATDLNREALYRALSEGGNPRLDTLTKVLGAMGLRVAVTVQQQPRIQ